MQLIGFLYYLSPGLYTVLNWLPSVLQWLILGAVGYQLRELYRSYVARKRKALFRGATAIVTGGASGIGRHMALTLAKDGVNVAICDVDELGARETVRLLLAQGVHARSYNVDIREPQEVKRVVHQITRDFNAYPRIIINNAGIVSGKAFLDEPFEQMENTFRVNTFSQMYLLKACVPGMLQESRKGKACHIGMSIFMILLKTFFGGLSAPRCITVRFLSNLGTHHIRSSAVSISSAAALSGVRKLSSYCGSKAALVTMMETVKYELQDLQQRYDEKTRIDSYRFSTEKFKAKSTPIGTTLVFPYYIDTGTTPSRLYSHHFDHTFKKIMFFFLAGMFDKVSIAVPSILPLLKTQPTSERIIRAIYSGQEWLSMPFIIDLLPAVSAIFPVFVKDALWSALSINESMDTFRGRVVISKERAKPRGVTGEQVSGEMSRGSEDVGKTSTSGVGVKEDTHTEEQLSARSDISQRLFESFRKMDSEFDRIENDLKKGEDLIRQVKESISSTSSLSGREEAFSGEGVVPTFGTSEFTTAGTSISEEGQSKGAIRDPPSALSSRLDMKTKSLGSSSGGLQTSSTTEFLAKMPVYITERPEVTGIPTQSPSIGSAEDISTIQSSIESVKSLTQEIRDQLGQGASMTT